MVYLWKNMSECLCGLKCSTKTVFLEIDSGRCWASRFPCCDLFVLSWNTNENPSTDKLSRAINYCWARQIWSSGVGRGLLIFKKLFLWKGLNCIQWWTQFSIFCLVCPILSKCTLIIARCDRQCNLFRHLASIAVARSSLITWNAWIQIEIIVISGSSFVAYFMLI